MTKRSFFIFMQSALLLFLLLEAVVSGVFVGVRWSSSELDELYMKISSYYLLLALFIILTLIFKIIFRKNNSMFYIFGLTASIAFMAITQIRFNIFEMSDMSNYDKLCFITCLSLLVNSSFGFFVTRKERQNND